jgi:hypothetical protein
MSSFFPSKKIVKRPLLKYSLLCLAVYFQFNCQANPDSLLNRLNTTISASPEYDARKLNQIAKLKQVVSKDHSTDSFDNFLKLYNEYQVFNYDSAYTYAIKLQQNALQTGDSSRIAYSKIKLGFILLSSGMFKEVFDVLQNINLRYLNNDEKAEYYTVSARYYYDLADYDKDESYSPAYNMQGNRYIDSSLILFPVNSFQYTYYNGLKNIRSGKIDQAFLYFDTLMHTSLSPHQFAVTASTLSDIYIQRGHTDTAISLLIRAAISDIESSTKETSAAFNLATLLFRQGDLKNASTYIEKAVNDALFYGARQRKVQLSAILPLIEAEKLNIVEKEKRIAIIYAVVVTFLLVLLIVLAIIIFRQVNKLKKAEKIITEANYQQKIINRKLLESNKIKEEYIGYFFSGNSEFYTRIEKFKKSVEQKIFDRKLDEIRFLVNNLNLKRERDELLKNFDQIFLRLFPNFTSEFNALIKDDDQVKLKEGEILNTDFRIFALIRMGIHDTDTIARILGYSVNTINTYKTRIKNKSIVPNEDFEEKIMQIKSI